MDTKPMDDNGWISVEDRLPEHRERVLVCGRTTYPSAATYDGTADEYRTWSGDGPMMYHTNYITHWQPLPNPPK